VSEQCSFCKEIFETPEALRTHIRLRHRDKVKLTTLEHPLGPKRTGKPTKK